MTTDPTPEQLADAIYRATKEMLDHETTKARVELLEALLKEVRLYQFPGYMEWLKRRDQALTKDTP